MLVTSFHHLSDRTSLKPSSLLVERAQVQTLDGGQATLGPGRPYCRYIDRTAHGYAL